MGHELSPAEQVAAFNGDWQRQNADLQARQEAAVASQAAAPPKSSRPPKTKNEKLLSSARGFTGLFSFEQLVYRAWCDWPEDFGLHEFALPCSHAVRNCLHGPRGMLTRGLLRRVGVMYEVAPEGRR